MSGPLGFVLFWITALAVGTAFVLIVLGGGFVWLLAAAVPLVIVLIVAARPRRRP